MALPALNTSSAPAVSAVREGPTRTFGRFRQHDARSDLWWLWRLDEQLDARLPALNYRWRYYLGDHDMAWTRPNVGREFRRLLSMSRANMMGLVIDAEAERLQVLGLRVSAADDADVDDAAWDVWQQSDLDSYMPLAFTDTLVKSRCPLMVWDGQITVEDASETVVAYEPGQMRLRAAALKRWWDDYDQTHRALLLLPDEVVEYARLNGQSQWEEQGRSRNPAGEVPVVELVNRPDIYMRGRSDLDEIIPAQDRLNKQIFDRMMASEFGSFRQRWATGLDIPVDESGQAVQSFKAAIDELWHTDDPETRFGEFGATDLTPYLRAAEQDITSIAVISRTPRHYLFNEGQSPSGDAIKSAESGLVSKVEEKQRQFSGPIRTALRLARRFAGEQTPPTSDVRWRRPETSTDGMIADAAMKLATLGIPLRELLEEPLGYPAGKVQRIMAGRAEEQMFRAAMDVVDEPELVAEPDVAAD